MRPWNPYQPPEDGLPPGEVRFLELRVEPWPDSHRVRVHMQITPFLERPNIEATITDAGSKEVANIHIIESIDDRMTFTMHIRSEEVKGPYSLTATLSYPDIGTVSQDSVVFDLNDGSS